jgi:hypothetical protein
VAQATCSDDACDRPAHARGMCSKHYMKWYAVNRDIPKRNYPTGTRKVIGSTDERFWQYVDSSDPLGCWRWTGAIDPQTGYGRMTVDGTTDYAHRVSYRLSIGDLDPKLTIDHLCRTRWCVNPLHLEQVTQRENLRRQPRNRVTHCPQGHPYKGDNLIEYKGRRYCRACRDARNAARPSKAA